MATIRIELLIILEVDLAGVVKFVRCLHIGLLHNRAVCISIGNHTDCSSEWHSYTFDELLLDRLDFYRMFLLVERLHAISHRLRKEVPRICSSEVGQCEEVFRLLAFP